jgi:putative permease
VLAIIKAWGRRYLSDPQAILLGGLLIGGVILLMAMGQILAPLIASIVIAYLLKSVVLFLKKRRIPELYAVLLVYGAFLGLFLVAILILWPIIWQQTLHLYQELPSMIAGFQHFLILLPEKFPEFLTKETVENGMLSFLNQLKHMGSILVTASLASLPTLITLIVYLFLVPLMVFFFLKDDAVISSWFANFLPKDRSLLTQVWQKVDKQIGNYIRGKVVEVIIVGIATYIAFYFFHTGYAALLAALVGFSVLIPYVGAVVVTVPVVLVAFFQWGLGSTFAYFLVVYGVIQAIDGTLLVPLLFSGAVSLHPIAIISAVLIFGGWWGFWGVFFAIPLAALVKAVLETWPKREL